MGTEVYRLFLIVKINKIKNTNNIGVINVFFGGPCENRTRGSSVTGMNVSHYTNGPLKKVLKSPPRHRENLLIFRLVGDYSIPHRYAQDSLDHSNHSRWVSTFTLRLNLFY